MQLPFMEMMGLATNAIGLAKQAVTNSNPKGSFDAELNSALSDKVGGKNPLAQILSKDGAIDDETLQSLIGTPAGLLLFQYMAAMKEMGLQSADIQLVLNGKGAQMSDDALKALLAQAGIGSKDLEAILADPALMSDLKVQLSDSFKALINAQAQKDGIDPEALLQLAASDSNTIKEILDGMGPVKPLPQNKPADPAEMLAGGKTHKPEETGEQKMSVVLGLIQRNVSHTTNEIRAAVAETLKKVTGTEAASAAAAALDVEEAGPGIVLKVENAVSTAENTLGIAKEDLKDLFFETDPVLRQQTVDRVTAQVNAYLKANEGKALNKEASEALAFLKTAMSEPEFAGIDRSLKLWQPGQAIADTKFSVNKDMYAALSKNLGDSNTSALFDDHMKQVIDQLRQTIPSQMKNGEGQVTMRLNPPMLGQVDVSMSMLDGQLQATFKTDQMITRDILVQNMSILKDALADQGIKATQFSVSMTFDDRSPRDGAYTFAGQDRHSHGFGQQGRDSDNPGRSFKGDDGVVYAQANYSGLLDGGLDLFA